MSPALFNAAGASGIKIMQAFVVHTTRRRYPRLNEGMPREKLIFIHSFTIYKLNQIITPLPSKSLRARPP